MQAEQELVFNILKEQWQFVRDNHGSLYDRGQADSYYHRPRQPHFGGVGGDSGPRVAVTDTVSMNEYLAGYNWNEQYGDKKDWS